MITQKRLKEVITYNKRTGIVTQRVWRGGTSNAGTVAGCPNQAGYLRMNVDGKLYYLHHLIWLYVTGKWPTNRIDHRDLNKANNKWRNLREATHGQNTMNRKVRSDSSSGVKGVIWAPHVGMYRARITCNGKKIDLGYHKSLMAAGAAYMAAAKQYHGKFARVK